MSNDSNINTDTLRVDVAYLILFSFPHSWWMNLAQEQIYSRYARNVTWAWNWNWTELNSLLNIKISLKSWPQLNRGSGLPASPWEGPQNESIASSLPHEPFWSGQTEADSLEGSASYRPSWEYGESDFWHPPFLPRPPLPKALFSIWIHTALLTCLPRDCICPSYNFIFTSNLKVLLPFPRGLD